MNRILNPSVRNNPAGDHNTVKPAMKAQEGAIEQSRQPGAGTGTATTDAARASGAAGTVPITEEADKTGASSGAQVPMQHKRELFRNDTGFRLDFTDKSLLNGIIMAEVLGKPKYFKKGRWS